MRGKDVELLQQELRQLGFAINDEAGYFGSSTRRAVERFQEENNLEMTGVVDKPTATRINEAIQALEPEPESDDTTGSFVVGGHVRKAEGSPLVGAIVRAFDKDLRHEESLGEEVTDESGRYEIAYTAEQFRRAEKKRADLIVRVFDQEDQELIASDILFNAQTEETVNLMIGGGEYRGPSEYERLLAEITPILENVPLTELSEEDISFLSSETGLVSQHIEFLALASKRAQETDLPTEIFYGFARQDFSISTLKDIFRQERHTLHNALIAALAGNIIPERLRTSIDSILDQLNERAVTEELEGESSMGALLRTSPILKDDLERQKSFISIYREYRGSSEAFWKELPGNYPEFADENVIKELQVSLELGRITLNHPPLVKIIQDELRQNDSLPDLRELATWEVTDWRQRIETAGTPPTIPGETEEERSKYAEAIFQAVEIRFPTAVIAHRLGNTPEDLQNLPGADSLLQVFKQDSSFELGKENIDLYLGGPDADDNIKADLKSWQRVYRISPQDGRYDVMRVLKRDGLDCAQNITRMGRTAFMDQYSGVLGDSEQVDMVWNKSSHVNAMVLSLVSQFSGQFNTITPKAIPYQPIDEVEGVPNWKELFGSLDFCECEHCKSVYGPAAYFVDLLYFLKNASPKNKKSPLTALLSRRPDLSEIELSCSNTNTVMPYVDLVNEVLENALAWFILKHSAADLDDSILNQTIREKFNQAGYRLSAKAKLSTIHKRNQWRVIDGVYIYVILHQKDNQHIVYHLLKNQTRATQDELSAIPEHLSEQAYLKLSKAVYPWDLPFDLWFEESRVYLKHLGAKRYQWMEKFRKDKPLDAACDHLGITEQERKLITSKLGTSEYNLWGLKQKQEYEKLRSVGAFLKQAGFDNKNDKSDENFKALCRLLVGTLYVRKDSTITITVDANCDFDKTKIENDKDAASNIRSQKWESILNRARRFLRLQRKLGWTIYELDKTITAFNANLDGKKGDDFLQQISFVERLRAELKVPLIEMLSWWGLIDTFADQAEEEENKKEKSLYEQLFLNKTVSSTGNGIFKLNANGTDLAKTNEKITSHTSAVVSALVISLANLRLLLAEMARYEEKLQNKKIDPNKLTLNLSRLSRLYRMVSLAKGLKLSVKKFLAAKAVIGIDPFKSTEDTFKFVEKVQKIQASSFSITELNYLLRHQYEVTDGIVPTDADVAKIMAEIRSGLLKILKDTSFIPDPQGTMTKAKLSLLVPENRVNELLEVINGDSKKNESVQNKLIDELLKPYVDTQAVKKQLVGQNALKKTEKAERFEYFLKQFLPYLRNVLSENLVKQKLSTALKLDADIFDLLLKTYIKGQLDAIKPVFKDFLALSDSGLFAEYYKNTNLSGNSEKQRIDSTIDFQWLKNPLGENAGNFSVKWSGMVQVEQQGIHIFHLQASGGAELWIDNQKIINDWAKNSIDVNKNVKLKAGKFYDILLKYQSIQNGSESIKLSWTPPSAPKQVIPANKLLPSLPKQAVPKNRLVPPTALLFCGNSYCLLHKLAMVITKFEIQVDELDYLSAHSDDFEKFDLNKFPIKASEKNSTLFKQWERLYEIFTFRSHYSQADIRLIDVFEGAYQSVATAKAKLIKLTG